MTHTQPHGSLGFFIFSFLPQLTASNNLNGFSILFRVWKEKKWGEFHISGTNLPPSPPSLPAPIQNAADVYGLGFWALCNKCFHPLHRPYIFRGFIFFLNFKFNSLGFLSL